MEWIILAAIIGYSFWSSYYMDGNC